MFRDNLHQPQYVEKLDKLVRFCIKEKVLTLKDLDLIWACQDGKHEIIVKNIHDLLVKLAWDFSPEQLDHLFGCFQVSCVSGSCSHCLALTRGAGLGRARSSVRNYWSSSATWQKTTRRESWLSRSPTVAT